MNELQSHADRLSGAHLPDLAANSTDARIEAVGWTVDMSRQWLDSAASEALIGYGEDAGLISAVSSLFSGDIVNPSEDRPALHWALRKTPGEASQEVMAVRRSVDNALAFAEQLLANPVLGPKQTPFKAILHIGIGGSDFGPRLLHDAFPLERDPDIDLRFCANVDPYDFDRAIAGLNPSNTLVIGVSKSFGTEETLYNLGKAQAWLQGELGHDWHHHLALITANRERAEKWLDHTSEQIFDMPLSVGGRFSLWSAASLACMLSLGHDRFRRFLDGAEAMDQHVRTTPVRGNLPVRLALLDYWNATIRQQPMRVLLAYANRLRLLPAYLQQLEMESNGKSVTPEGAPAQGPTAPALWGGEGSIGQHSYHQWLHQGSQRVATEFILALDGKSERTGSRSLVAHALAQAEVLSNGRLFEDIKADDPDLPDHVARQKVHPGGRASTLMVCEDFNAFQLGALIALYEHRTYLGGVLWGINSFDQWGVERGKTMAGTINDALAGGADASDPVSAYWVDRFSDRFG